MVQVKSNASCGHFSTHAKFARVLKELKQKTTQDCATHNLCQSRADNDDGTAKIAFVTIIAIFIFVLLASLCHNAGHGDVSFDFKIIRIYAVENHTDPTADLREKLAAAEALVVEFFNAAQNDSIRAFKLERELHAMRYQKEVVELQLQNAHLDLGEYRALFDSQAHEILRCTDELVESKSAAARCTDALKAAEQNRMPSIWELSKSIDKANHHAVQLAPENFLLSGRIWAIKTMQEPEYFRYYDGDNGIATLFISSHCKAYVEDKTATEEVSSWCR